MQFGRDIVRRLYARRSVFGNVRGLPSTGHGARSYSTASAASSGAEWEGPSWSFYLPPILLTYHWWTDRQRLKALRGDLQKESKKLEVDRQRCAVMIDVLKKQSRTEESNSDLLDQYKEWATRIQKRTQKVNELLQMGKLDIILEPSRLLPRY